MDRYVNNLQIEEIITQKTNDTGNHNAITIGIVLKVEIQE